MATLRLEIVTPETRAYSDDVDMVVIPATEGEIGVLPMHVPLMTQITPGELVVLKGNQTLHLAIGEGFVEVTQERVNVLTDMPRRPSLRSCLRTIAWRAACIAPVRSIASWCTSRPFIASPVCPMRALAAALTFIIGIAVRRAALLEPIREEFQIQVRRQIAHRFLLIGSAENVNGGALAAATKEAWRHMGISCCQ